MTWTLHYTKQAQKDAKKLASSGLKTKAQALFAILEEDPWQSPPLRKARGRFEWGILKAYQYSTPPCLSGFRSGEGRQNIEALDAL